MKYLKIFVSVLFLFFATISQAQAAWVKVEIRNIVITPTSGSVVIQLVDTITHPACSQSDNNDVRNIALLDTSRRFEEMYARALITEANGETFEILNTTGTCNQSGNTISAPTLRFGL